MNVDQRLTAIEDRLDRMARINEYIVAKMDRTDATIRRIVDRQSELADVADLLDRGLGTLIREFVAHRADGHGAA